MNPAASDISAHLRASRANWLPRVFPAGRVRAGVFYLGNPDGDAGESFPVPLDGNRAESLTDFGGDFRGDDLDLLARGTRQSLADALKDAAAMFGLDHGSNNDMKRNSPKPAQKSLEPFPEGGTLPDHPQLGRPDGTWLYRRPADNRPVLAHLRFDDRDADGNLIRDAKGKVRKQFRPVIWRDGQFRWEWADVRPLYGSPELAARPDAPVLVVEGEKAADAARQMLPGMVVITWPQGTNGAARSDWAPLNGRQVVIWPDADEPGIKAGATVAELVRKARAASVRVVSPPPRIPDGWDLADPLPGGWDVSTVNRMIREAPEPLRADDPPNEGPIGDEPPLPGDAGPCRIDPAPVAPVTITASPFIWRDPATIPCRQWLYGYHLIRQFVSLTVAPGAVGKTSLMIAIALALVIARDLIGTKVFGGPHRVWLWNLEDPREEIERRILATMSHYSITPEDIGDRLYLDSGRDNGLCIARQDRSGFTILEPVVDALVAELVKRRIDVLIVDPFVSSHQVSENDNGAIDAVAKAWGKVAERANCAIELVHHLRKLGDAEATAESARGAVALVAAARSVQVLNRMSKEEAEKAGVDTHRGYFRVGDDKNNLAPSAADADWFHMESVNLPNGDNVGVVVPWQWPNALDEVTLADLSAVQRAVDGKGCRVAPQSKEWAGHTVAEVLGLDTADKASRQKVSDLLKIWIKNGALKVVDVMDSARRPRATVEVGNWASVSCSSAPVQKSQTGADWRSDAKVPCSSAPVAPVPSVGGTGNWSGAEHPAGGPSEADIDALAGEAWS